MAVATDPRWNLALVHSSLMSDPNGVALMFKSRPLGNDKGRCGLMYSLLRRYIGKHFLVKIAMGRYHV